jgi:predicted  nucleic acid-binding Zn-ribbon protein
MPKIFLIAAAALLLLSALFGVLNKSKLTAKQEALKTATAAQATAENNARKAVTAQQKAERAASDAAVRMNDLQGTLTAANKQVTDLGAQVDDIKKSVADKDAQIAQLNDKIKTLGTPVVAPVANPADATQLAEFKTQLAELNTVKDGLESQLKAAQSQLAAAQKSIQDRNTMATMNGLRGQVLAVDRNWNFVVLNLGNRNGVVSNATMIVQRGSSMVGRIRITSVEPSQSIADIIPNSVPAGISVQPGDVVVYPGS